MHLSRTKLTVSLVLAAVLGIGIGAAGMFYMSGMIYGSGIHAKHIADATVDVAALEKIAAADTVAAQQILRARLRGAMLGLRAEAESLSPSQIQEIHALELRAKPYVGDFQSP